MEVHSAMARLYQASLTMGGGGGCGWTKICILGLIRCKGKIGLRSYEPLIA